MALLTLTTDLGIRDHYLASLKARALRLIPGVQMVDISHHIPAFDVAKSAFALRHVWAEFPPKTVHLVSVDAQWSKSSPFAVVLFRDHYFIATDNGFFSLLFDGEPVDSIYTLKLKGDEDLNFPARDVFIPAAARIFAGEPMEQWAKPAENYLRRQSLRPVVEGDNLRGAVVHVDEYGNVITNITLSLFESTVGHQAFRILVRRGDSDLSRISRSYADVPEGEKVALFNSAGLLEIAINRGVEGSGGGATHLLGLKENDVVRIEIGED